MRFASIRSSFTAVARESATTMLALIFKCPENAACLMQSSELSSSLGKELRLTGDYQIQVDLMEIIFRATKHGLLPDILVQQLGQEVVLQLGELTTRPVKSIDLATELRSLVMAFNKHLGLDARIHSVYSKAYCLGQMKLPGQWIDFGQPLITLSLPDEVGHGTCPEILDIDAGACKAEIVIPSGKRDETILRLSLHTMPDELKNAAQQLCRRSANHKAFKIDLVFHTADFSTLCNVIPQVSDWAQRKTLQASKNMLGSEETLPISARPASKAKCSVGVYPTLELTRPPPSASARPKLVLSSRGQEVMQPASSAVMSAAKMVSRQQNTKHSQEDLIVESLEEAPAAMRDGHGAVKHSSPLAAHMPDEPIQTAAAVSNNPAVDDHPSLTSPQCAQPQSDLEKGNPAPELMLPQESKDAPEWMLGAAVPDGCLLMLSSSHSGASTNASQDSQNSMEHAQKITPEEKQGQPASRSQNLKAAESPLPLIASKLEKAAKLKTGKANGKPGPEPIARPAAEARQSERKPTRKVDSFNSY
ncbi:hypothetical protein WJX84_005319 [Apatococcus fuscideae]|uniref:Uncharacterized protein n=1 Tax=Apatococcus fuscideae TaxID=2026836 RepID=A0AAW1S7U9_9CHLO